MKNRAGRARRAPLRCKTDKTRRRTVAAGRVVTDTTGEQRILSRHEKRRFIYTRERAGRVGSRACECVCACV